MYNVSAAVLAVLFRKRQVKVPKLNEVLNLEFVFNQMLELIGNNFRGQLSYQI